jgi:hypothetical protein
MSIEDINAPVSRQEQLDLFGAPEESESFPGSKIITVKEGDEYTRFALRRGEDGKLQGNKFALQEYKVVPGANGQGFWDNSSSLVRTADTDPERYRIGPTYQIGEDRLTELESALKEKGVEI